MPALHASPSKDRIFIYLHTVQAQNYTHLLLPILSATKLLASSAKFSSSLPTNNLPRQNLDNASPRGPAPNMLAIPKTPTPVSGCLTGTETPATFTV